MSKAWLGIGTLLLATSLACAGDPPPETLARCPTGPVAGVEVDAGLLGDTAGDAARGEVLFEVECSRCHSARVLDRSSRLFRGYPRLDCPEYLRAASDDYLAAVIHTGGEAVGLDPAMKPFAEKLGDGDLASLIAHLRESGKPGN